MIKAILFDFDGTLANTLFLYIKAYDIALKKFGIKLNTKQIVTNCFSVPEEEICKYFNIKNVKAFRHYYFNQAKNFYKKAKLFPRTIQTLKFLREKNISLAITTFAFRWYIEKMIDHFMLNGFFDLILSIDDVIYPKPHPEMALKACSTLNVLPENSLVVGDSKGDILMGKAAGCQTVLFFPKQYNKIYNFEKLKKTKPDYIISSISSLNKIIKL